MHSHLFHKYSLIRLPATSWKHCTHFLSFLEPISTHLLFPESYRGSSGVTYITFFFLVCTTFPLSHCLWHLELQASGESMNTTVRQDYTFPSLAKCYRWARRPDGWNELPLRWEWSGSVPVSNQSAKVNKYRGLGIEFPTVVVNGAPVHLHSGKEKKFFLYQTLGLYYKDRDIY